MSISNQIELNPRDEIDSININLSKVRKSSVMDHNDYKKQVETIKFVLPQNVQEEGIIISIEAFQRSKLKLIFYYFLIFISGGLFYLFCRWDLKMFIKMTLTKTQNIEEDNLYFLVKGEDESSQQLCKPTYKKMKVNDIESTYMCICYRLYNYYYDKFNDTFKPIQFNLYTLSNNEIHKQHGQGQTAQNVVFQRAMYGQNNTEIPPKSLLTIFIDEILTPFYVFQLFSIILWYSDQYYYYSSVILLTSLISIYVTLDEAYKNYINLKKMSYFETKVFVYRGVQEYLTSKNNQLEIDTNIQKCRQEISSLDLVPGDIIEIPEQQFMPSDLILLNGSAVMNESMLTGESIPVIKNSLPYNNNLYDPNSDGKMSTIYAGTHCIETRYYKKEQLPILGIVSQTGFNTIKGELVRSILFPKESNFSFYSDALKYVGVLATFSIIGFSASLHAQIEGINEGYYGVGKMIKHALDMVTVTVPPALPTCLSLGISLALGRMKKKQIFCISPPKVNISGQVTRLCFDKTGTLTEDGLDLYGIRPVMGNDYQDIEFVKIIKDIDSLNKIQLEENSKKIDYRQICLQIMAACHSLTRVNGELIGDPLEVKMFESTNWVLEESGLSQKYDELVLASVIPPQQNENENENQNQITSSDQLDIENNSNNGSTSNNDLHIGLVKRFEFSSKLQRMSTVVKLTTQKKYTLYVKGAPEKIKELCRPETVPLNFQQKLNFYSQKGYRVLGLAYKDIDLDYRQIQKSERDPLEKDLIYVGILVMENKLKEVTKLVIEKLQDADIKTIMVTGDNVLTAISVGRQCSMVKEQEKLQLVELVSNETEEKLQWTDFETGTSSNNLCSFIKIHDSQTNLEHLNSQKKQSRKVDKSKFDITSDKVLAVTGGAFGYILDKYEEDPKENHDLLNYMLLHAKVYARMKPEQKAQMVKMQQQLGGEIPYTVGMVGDGANDCAALKSADVGISLSEAEASIAAPFTSKIQDISCVLTVLKEGRAALVTSFQCFKYMALYSMIQFVTVTLLYFIVSLPSDFQFLYWDLFIIIPLAFLMGMTEAYDTLSKQIPGSKLISFSVLSSVIGQTFIQGIFQIVVYVWMVNQKWYISCPIVHRDYFKDLDSPDDQMQECFEPTVLFWVTNFQYIITCVVFSIGKPWRKPFYTNHLFSYSVVILLGLSVFIQLCRWNGITQLFDYLLEVDKNHKMPSQLPYWLILVSVINSLITILYEQYALPPMNKCWDSFMLKREIKKLQQKNKEEKLE